MNYVFHFYRNLRAWVPVDYLQSVQKDDACTMRGQGGGGGGVVQVAKT